MRKGPVHYIDWTEALSHPLDAENYTYLKCGKLKEKELTASLFNRISDYVVEEFNRGAEAVKRAERGELIYVLVAFTAKLARLFFYQGLSFFEEKHKDALTCSVKDALNELIRALSARDSEPDADLLYEICILKRLAGGSL